jgi:hypothetical protein
LVEDANEKKLEELWLLLLHEKKNSLTCEMAAIHLLKEIGKAIFDN